MATQTDFGANEWLVQEIYQQYQQDPGSVDEAWHEFFADYEGAGAQPQGIPAGESATRSRDSGSSSGPGTGAGDGETSAGHTTDASPTTDPEGGASSADSGRTASGPSDDAAAGDGSASGTPGSGSGKSSAPGPTSTGSGGDRSGDAPKKGTPDETDGDAAPGDGGGPETERLKGFAAAVARNMETSLSVPTATSVRAVPAKLLIDNRTVINRHLARSRGGKLSFTHLIGWALVRAVQQVPGMNRHYDEVDGKPVVVTPEHINLGLAIDLPSDDGSRKLVVPSIKGADEMDFAAFWRAYEGVVKKARDNQLGADDYAGTTISLTNPGTIGTVHSVPRLMAGQSAIVGVGAMEYPAEYQGASPETLANLAISKIMTLTSTYDHRVIQGAESGQFLKVLHELLLGGHGFYDEVFRALKVPYEPVRWAADISTVHDDEVDKPGRVLEVVHAYRVRGHLMADTDPLEIKQRSHPDLDITRHGLTLWDLDREFAVGGFSGQNFMTLRDVLGVLRDAYCRTVGVEYMHLQDPEQRRWIQERVEKPVEKPDPHQQLHVLERLGAAEAFESYLQTKFVGQKRFSLEGAESTVPTLDAICGAAAADGLDEVCIGMPHRGRLNVLVNIVGKPYKQVFGEFEGNIDPRTAQGSGDVKYHLGAEGTFTARTGETVEVTLTANPSHLEAVDPVLEGIVRAKQDVIDRGEEGFSVLPVLLHGDAAFAGQGVVAETLNLSQLRGYRTGGTVHLVVNNQVGFTTSPGSGRSSTYATDVARMVQAPIFHVNGDDPDACVRVAEIAFAYRQAWRKDVVIDLVCYRRRGHSEVDEPSFTQPLMYDVIDAKRSTRKIYTEDLVGRGDISREEAEEALRSYQKELEQAFEQTRESGDSSPPEQPMQPSPATVEVDTAIDDETVKAVLSTQVTLPDGFTVHKRLAPQLQKRASSVDEGALDWATGELLAFGSLLRDGHPVRLAGQDSRRGTFGQRHAVVVDRETGAEHTPLHHLEGREAAFYVYDSALSEFAGLGFEYGYATVRPQALTLWEAQFGDFINGAQTIVDEFISSGEVKWNQKSGVTLLLPHGYEGQGPDHSSARIERFLVLCAEDNMTVATPSTPASYFHLLRWQVLSGVQRPLVIFTPKSVLRLRAAASSPDDFTSGRFQPVLTDPEAPDAEAVRRVVLCSGKVYYDLAAQRRKREVDDVALVRVEQLYPLPGDAVGEAVGRLPAGRAGRLGAGGAGEHGRLAAHGAAPRRPPARGPAAAPGEPARQREPGRRLGEGARGRAGRRRRRGPGPVVTSAVGGPAAGGPAVPDPAAAAPSRR